MHRALLRVTATALVGFGALTAHAASYRYVGPNYNSVTNFTAPCSGGNCVTYTTSMVPSGVITTSAPLAAGLLNADISAQVTYYSVSDGVNTFTSADAGARAQRFNVSTDGSGAITAYWIVVHRWQDNLAGPHATNSRIDRIELNYLGGNVFANDRCGTVGTSATGVADSCDLITPPDGAESTATYPAGGTWFDVPDLSINDVSAAEGNSGSTGFTFTVSLSATPSAPVSVGWSTANGTATAGTDFGSIGGTLNWAGGDGAAKTITVQVIGDTTVEPNETFRVVLGNASGAGLAKAEGVGTIINDDLAPPDLSLTKSEGGGSTAPGGTVSYTLTYSNTGGQGATGVTLTETVPANTTFNAGASTAGWSCVPSTAAGSTCTLAIGSVSAAASASAVFTVQVATPLSTAVTQVSNTASVADDGAHGADPTPANNTATDTTPVVHPATPPVMGNVPDQTATTGIPFTLALAGYVTPTDSDPINSYAIASGSLPPGLNLNVGTGVISGTPTSAGTFSVTVTASDKDGASTADAIQFTVAAGAVSNIPTLSEWGLLLLAALLAATVWMRRPGHVAPRHSTQS